jgi:hypothetical protein
MFLLIAGRARHYSAQNLKARLRAVRTAGAVDLRDSSDYLTFEVLTQREYANYVAVSDIGLTLYQEEQRNVMSGVLGDYVWAGRPLIATENSYTGAEVRRNDLGVLLHSEDPETLAVALTDALRMTDHPNGPSALTVAYRDRIAPNAVLRRLQEILDSDGDPLDAQCGRLHGSGSR